MRFSTTYCLGTLLALMSFLPAIPLRGAVLHVSADGSDGNKCTESEPCKTITRGALLALPGDTVRVQPGTYEERVMITRSGSEGGGLIKFEGHPGTGCGGVGVRDINSRGVRPLPTVVLRGNFYVDASYIKIDCFEVTATASAAVDIAKNRSFITMEEMYIHDGPAAAVNMARVELSQMPKNITISRNYITRTSYGFFVFCGGNCLIDYNEVEQNTTTNGADLDYARLFGEGITFRRNYFHGNRVQDCVGCHIDCFQTWEIGQYNFELARNVEIDGNVCFNAHQGIIARSTVGGAIDKIKDWRVTNNIFRYGPIGSSMAWCALFEHVGNILFAHNLCGAGNTGYRGGATAKHVNNIHYSLGLNPYNSDSTSVVKSARNFLYSATINYKGFLGDILNTDPLWMNAFPDDYRPQPDSPLVDAGVLTDVPVDRNGNPRVSGVAPDIGPYEVIPLQDADGQPVARRRRVR